ncbi:FGGY-family carbohydrate kinase [Aquamicrobium sp. LC103]|uniref:FGGY-family carbohydrate kinase n=1 Tax=Aquamicrobium sp. LC103 TaxID=1120658 RepID=UPI00063EBF0A|nr:FGGY-family carbohydrate kinase [Aquamicrobium sp. LC103]
MRKVAVIDIGKTNAKVVLVDLETLTEIDARRIANRPVSEAPYPHHDVERLWTFILDGLACFAREHKVDAISTTTHGATAALLCSDGSLALPVLDYEHDGPDRLRGDYEARSADFEETGSPPLPQGLNLGAQLFWLERSFPEAFSETSSILTYPQYWGHRLTGVAASEVTSLGCHTDLWAPARSDYSSLVDRMGWRARFAPIRPARSALGPILPQLAATTGLDPETPVFCGIHDSNASLLPHLLTRPQPFSVVSTGTWVVSMAMGGENVQLDCKRDTLVNVSALGAPVPSARFMGGREYEMLTAGLDEEWSERDVEAVLARGVAILPSVLRGCGPFPSIEASWTVETAMPGERIVAASFYLAMMTATCLELIGARGDIVIEGPLASNTLFLRMLNAATRRPVVAQSSQATGASIGAALLATEPTKSLVPLGERSTAAQASWIEYAAIWNAATHERTLHPLRSA